jgi:hypothetical protein
MLLRALLYRAGALPAGELEYLSWFETIVEIQRARNALAAYKRFHDWYERVGQYDPLAE